MKKVIIAGILLMPFVAFGAIGDGVGNFAKLISFLTDGLKLAAGLIISLAVVYFLWNVFGFVMSAGDQEARAEKQKGIIYGVIGIAVMVSIWGLVTFLTQSARLDGVNTPVYAPPLPL